MVYQIKGLPSDWTYKQWVPIERTGFAREPLVFKLTSSAFMPQKNYAKSK